MHSIRDSVTTARVTGDARTGGPNGVRCGRCLSKDFRNDSG